MKAVLTGLLLVPSLVFADVSFGTGEDKNCEIARAMAIRDALESHSGIEFDYVKKESCTEKNSNIDCTFKKDFDTNSSGTLKKVLKEDVKQKKDVCVVEVKVEVEPTKALFVNLELKDKYLDGEPLEFKVYAGEPVYLYVFNVASSVELIFPTSQVDFLSNLIDTEFVFPGTDRASYVLYSESGNTVKGQLVFLFTKHKMFDRKMWTKTELEDIIRSMPAFSRKVIYNDIIIQRRFQ
jgi:hypothetical protein